MTENEIATVVIDAAVSIPSRAGTWRERDAEAPIPFVPPCLRMKSHGTIERRASV